MNYSILTPIWKLTLDQTELENVTISLSSCPNIDHYFLHPDGLDISFYHTKFPVSRFISLACSNFSSISSYSKMLLSSDFYRMFSTYDGILICQTDAILLGTLPPSILRYDYVGAPWVRPFRLNKCRINGARFRGWLLAKIGVGFLVDVGNGGLSWRKVKSFSQIDRLLIKNGIEGAAINEDLVIAYLGACGCLSLPIAAEAEKVFLEYGAAGCIRVPSVCGFHALDKINLAMREEIVREHSDLVGRALYGLIPEGGF